MADQPNKMAAMAKHRTFRANLTRETFCVRSRSICPQNETETNNMSIALYRYMCQEIIGTEEQVKTIRMMNNIRDNLNSSNKKIVITSGSFGEGLEMHNDLDIMIVSKFIEVTEDVNIQFISGTVYFTMASENTPSLFTKLRLLHCDNPSIFDLCDEMENHYYLSNSLVKQKVRSNIYLTIHGPCVADKGGLCDFAYSVRSKSWITQANKWITRPNNGWPDCDVKKSIVKHGTLFVPIGVKGSIHEELEWRISFSVGEKLLIYTFTHAQLLCYTLMKIVLKDVINNDPHCKDLLCSYFIKTVMFWISEESSTSIWKPQNLISCFMRCFRRLIYFVEYSVCPHYFIPQNNLFENKINGQSQKRLLNKLYILSSSGWQCILFSDEIANLYTSAYAISKEPRFLNFRCVEAILCSMIYIADDLSSDNIITFKKGLHRVLSIKSSKIKSLYMYYISKFCCRSDRLQSFDGISDNIFTSKQYKTCVSTLLFGMHHDAVSGWLFLASFFYKTKEYKIALDILQYCLSKCTQEKLFIGMTLSHIQNELFNLQVFRGLTIVQMYKFLLISNMFFKSNHVLIPDEIRVVTEELDSRHNIAPVVYAHTLCFLCHYHLYNSRQCLDSHRNLQLTIENNYFIATSYDEALSYNMLGITFKLLGDTESARQAFMQSLEINPDPSSNDASRRLELTGLS